MYWALIIGQELLRALPTVSPLKLHPLPGRNHRDQHFTDEEGGVQRSEVTTQRGAVGVCGDCHGKPRRLPLIFQLCRIAILPCSGSLTAPPLHILTSHMRAVWRNTVTPHTPTALYSLQSAFIAIVRINPQDTKAFS